MNISFADDPSLYINDPKGFHGMLLFGSGDNFYISHLPMWMKPHDYQMIAKVKLSDSIINRIKLAKINGQNLFSVEPGNIFVLPKFALGEIPSFKSTIYNGHFERDGKPIGSSDITFESLVFFKKLKKDEQSPAPNKQKYVLFGDKNKQYLIHMAHGYPEIDEILEITPFQSQDILNKIKDDNAIEMVCVTKDDKKNMQGLDESIPQDCSEKLDQCSDCEKTLASVDPSAQLSNEFPNLFNKVMIIEDIYTDTKDLGAGYEHHSHMGM